MMRTKISFLLFLLLVNLARRTSGHVEKAPQKRMVSYNAFSNDINECLFQYWTPGLSKPVECNGKELCYGDGDLNMAQYAVCYNQKTLIPVFTGHIVKPDIGGVGGGNYFRADDGVDPVAKNEDYVQTYQDGLFANYIPQRQFFHRGHLTPNADFGTPLERSFTMTTTNIAPQWSRFNFGNWKYLEMAIRKYATDTENALYVFTGTGGAAKNLAGNIIVLHERVLAPEWYWKAVCDPEEKQSVFFLGENTITDTADNQEQVKGCFDILQQKKNGVIQCFSLNHAKKNFKEMFQIPELHAENCDPSKIGDKFKSVLETSLH